MKQKCKQCGKEFVLSQKEIEFYKQKNLNLPKRCADCRAKNRKMSGKENGPSEYEHSNVVIHEISDSPFNKKKSPVLYILLAALAIVLATVFGKQEIGDFFAGIAESHSVANTESELETEADTTDFEIAVIPSAVQQEEATEEVTEKASVEADTEVAETNETGGIETTDENESLTETAVDDSQRNRLRPTIVDKQSDTEEIIEEEEPEEAKAPKFTFRSASLKNEHYEKHGREMGFASADEYEMAASAVVTNPSALHKKEKEDGDNVFYIEATNEFVIVSTRGYIRTYFKPDAGKAYYDRQ